MIIKDLFKKSIEREIKGVIKVGQAQDENIQQELEEYVVTRELRRHFREFFSGYSRGITGDTDKMGVWISGFFGSGKSHFLKILSYILENKEIARKRAVEYFANGEKQLDPTTIGDMRLAANTPSTVILFNVDSKSESAGKQSKDAIVSVFLKAFNEKLGFCGAYPSIADLERRLTDEGKYNAFKEKFQELNGGDWLEERNSFDFISDDVVDALAAIGFMSVEAARNWSEKATDPYVISIERFAQLIREYIKEQGRNHHVIFLVDEIGQYIGDNSDLMLNLQTVTEDLGMFCEGKAWVVVTSQQDIDSITRVKGNNFSKIQGRFDTRISLTSANVDEVIRERILKKNDVAKSTLAILYDEKATEIKNKIIFGSGPEMKFYSDREDFSAVYPFVPYQFDLLGDVLTQIRTHGASGKHLADGERSMLALFQESAKKIDGNEIGTLVPFNMFYEPLEAFVDNSHSSVITRALYNEYLNPNHEPECFDVEVLKTLFLIKYVDRIKATTQNVTSLMISSIGDDRLKLSARVEQALGRLVKQMLVQKSGDEYIFLTNEEQEINQAIVRENVDPGEVTAKISEMIFDGLFDTKKYRHPAFNGRYSYGFNQVVDIRPYKTNQNYPLTLKFLTPDSEEFVNENAMKLYTGQSSSVLVALPDDRAFIDELRAALQTEKYLRKDSMGKLAKYEDIKAKKRVEIREHYERGRLYLEEAIRAAKIYVNGDLMQPTSKEVNGRINEALGRLVSSVYHKLSYIDKPVDEADIREVLKIGDQQLSLTGMTSKPNTFALGDVASFIDSNTDKHMKTSMKTLMDRFMAPPYGFVEVDIQWLVASLFREGGISLELNGESVTRVNKQADEIFRFITRKEYLERLLMERKVRASDRQKKLAKDLMNRLFGVTPFSDDDDAMMASFKTYASKLNQSLADLENKYYTHNPGYPGHQVIMEGRQKLTEIAQLTYATEFFAHLEKRKNELLDFAEDYDPIKSFFGGEQLTIFTKALQHMAIYNESKTFIVDADVEAAVQGIRPILSNPRPYGQIYKLPGLMETFLKAYTAVLAREAVPVQAAIDDARSRAYAGLSGKSFKDKLLDSFREGFDELEEKAKRCNNVAALKNIKAEADALKIRCLNAIDAEEARLTPPSVDPGEASAPPQPLKKKRNISIKSVNSQQTWRLETPDDVHRYVGELEERLLAELRDDTVINLEF